MNNETMCSVSMFAFRSNIPMVYGLVLLVLLSLMGQHTIAASGQHNADSPVRKTTFGPVQGYLHTLKSSGQRVERYLGVPYARPPVGNLRFQKPVPPPRWDSVLATTTTPPACIQEALEKTYISAHNPWFNGSMSEDCLYINIYAPHNTSQESDPLPVLVHVHGGSNMVGMGAMIHGDVLASSANIIVVNFNYRLGPFGFLYMPQLGMMGNYGLFDQNLAFTWVKDNIAEFGGDPGRVTVQGHSAGAVDVGHHVLSPMAKGLFQSAILMSGSPTAFWALTFDSEEEDDDGRRERNLQMVDCANMNKENTIDCLCQLSYEKLANTYFDYKTKIFNFSPVLDGEYIVDHPLKRMATMAKDPGIRPNCDTVMLGVVRDEGSLTANSAVKNTGLQSTTRFITPPKDLNFWKLLEPLTDFGGLEVLAPFLYRPWQNEFNETARIIEFSNFFGDSTFTAPAIMMADALVGLEDSSVYVYRFNHISDHTAYPGWMGVPHGEDQFYIFGSPVEHQHLRNYTQEDALVSHKIMQLWARFVYNPKNVSLPDELSILPKYADKREYLEISSESGSGAYFEMKQYLRMEYIYFWNKVLPALKMQPPSGEQPEVRDEAVLWIMAALLCIFVILSLVLLSCLIFHLRNKKGAYVTKQELIEDSGNSTAT